MVGLYLAAWLGVMREGASQIQLLPCGLVSSYTAPPAAGQFCAPQPGSPAAFRLTRPGSSQREKGKCSSPRLRETWLLPGGA